MGTDANRRRWAISAIFVAHGLVIGTWAGNVPRFRELWSLRDGPLGLVLLAIGVGALAAMPVGGRLSARYGGARSALVAGGLFAALAAVHASSHALGLGGAWAWPGLLGMGVVVGLGAGITDIAMNAEASALERQVSRVIMSGMHGGWSLGAFAGGGIAAGCAAVGVPVAGTMILTALIALLVLAGAAVVLWRGSRPESAASVARTPRPSLRMLATLGVMTAICFEIEGAMADWSGVFLRDTRDAPLAVASAAYSGVALAMMLARFGGDAVRRRIGPVAMTRGGGLLAACAMASALLVPSVPIAMIAFAVVGLGVANVVPVLFSAAGLRGGSAAIAVVASVGYAGLLLGPPLIGFAAQALTLPVALWLVAAGALVIAGLARAVHPNPSPSPSPATSPATSAAASLAASSRPRASGHAPSDART